VKRLIVLLIALTFVVTSVGCGGTTAGTKTGKTETKETKKT
jgi:hypothetical protein